MTPRLILGSQSPRRKEIMNFFSLPFEQISPDFDEEAVPFRGDPGAYVCEIADGKAKSLATTHSKAIILTADTTVYQNGKIFGKPSTKEEAFEFFTHLSGKWHSVFTGVCVFHKGEIFSTFEETKVLFNQLTPEEIHAYHAKIQWADKAGGYMVQSAGGLVINKIDGCYHNAMGLPINSVRKLLLEVGVDLWDYIR